MTKNLRHAIVLVACGSVLGCATTPVATLTISSPTLVTDHAPALAPGIQSLEVSSGDAATPAAGDRLELGSLDATGKVTVRLTTAGGSTASVAGTPLPSGRWVPLPVTRLEKGTTIPLTVAQPDGESKTYQIASLPADFPDYTVTATTPKPGTICFAANTNDGKSPSYIFMTDEQGHPLFYKKLPDLGFDFQKHLAPDGTARYSYMEREGPQVAGALGGQGAIHLLDQNFHEIKKIALLPTAAHGALAADLHEFVYLDDNHYILIGLSAERVTNVPSLQGAATNVAAAVIQEVQNDQVVFDWDSSHYPEFYDNSSDGNDYNAASAPDAPNADYMHLNSVCVDPKDNNLLVSFRHQDQIVKLDRKTGDILWRLGGKNSDFPLMPAQRFSHQHYVRLNPDGTLSLFDNGNATQSTRMVTFTLDEGARAITRFDPLQPESRFSVAMGSFQWLDDTTPFIGWGAHTPGTSDATELGPDGKPTFSLTFTNPGYMSYRALKYLP